MTPVDKTQPSANTASTLSSVNSTSDRPIIQAVQSLVITSARCSGAISGIPFAPHLAPINNAARQSVPQVFTNDGNPPPPYNPDSAAGRQWIDSPSGLRWYSRQQSNSTPR